MSAPNRDAAIVWVIRDPISETIYAFSTSEKAEAFIEECRAYAKSQGKPFRPELSAEGVEIDAV